MLTTAYNNNTTKLNGTENSLNTISIGPIIKLIMAMLILTVNIFVLILFLVKSKLRKNISNKILFSLVSSDFATGFILVLHVLASTSPDISSPKNAISLSCRIFLDIITTWLQLVTMGNLALIIIERYVTLIHPYKVGDYLTQKRIAMAIRFVWLSSLLVPNIQLTWLYPLIRGDKLSIVEEKRIMHADSIYSAFTILLFVLLPMVVFFVAFARMFLEVKKFPKMENLNKKKEEKRVLIIFAAMYCLFLIFSLPYFLVRLLLDLQANGLFMVAKDTRLAVTLLKSLPPFLNPFLYVLNKPDFRNELRNKREHLTKALRQVRLSSTVSRQPSADPSHNSLLSCEINNNDNTVGTCFSSPANLIKNEDSVQNKNDKGDGISSPV